MGHHPFALFAKGWDTNSFESPNLVIPRLRLLRSRGTCGFRRMPPEKYRSSSAKDALTGL
jgi:hypothetical protein